MKVATLGAHGVSVIPVTGRQLREDPTGVIDRMQRALAEATKKANGSSSE